MKQAIIILIKEKNYSRDKWVYGFPSSEFQRRDHYLFSHC